MNQPQSSTDTAHDVGPAAGDMASRVAAFDWSRTPLGPMVDWPPGLRVAVSICLKSRFPMFVWWGPGLINIYNDAYVDVLGKRHPGALGEPASVIWEEIWDTVGPQAHAVMSRGESTWNERVLLVMERQGYVEETYFTWSYSPIQDGAGKIEGLFCACTEDTKVVMAERERDRQAEQRRRADERARTILESITDAFFALDRDWHFTYANPQGERLLDRSPGELIGLNIWQEYPGIVGTVFDVMYRRAMGEGEPGSATLYYADHDRWYEAHTYPSPDGISVFFRDVSDARRGEDALRQSEQRLAAVIETALDCIVGMDHQGRVTEWNPAAVATFGYGRDEALGQEMASLIIPPALRDLHRDGLAQYLATGEGPVLRQRLELTACRKDGTELPVELSITAIKSDGPPSFTGYLRDISDRKRAEGEREQLLISERAARAESERASQMKDEFLATLSHEIRTPLNAILGWSQIMRTSGDPADIASGLEVIERNARAQAQIVEDLLDMSRIISGKIRLDVQRVDLAAVVHTATEAARPTADAKGVRLLSVIDPLRGVVVSGDVSRLQQVLWNLLSNAIKFTQRGGRIQVLLERVNSHLEISVIDTGEGIPPEFIPYVFDRFRQADASTTRRHGGLGIGLSIVKQLVELHGGAIRVKSAGLGHGTTFTVALPLIVVHSEPEPGTDRRHPRALPAVRQVLDVRDEIKGLNILVVDDEPDARSLVKRLLEDCHATVTTTASVNEAVELIQSARFDVLVSDIGMPDQDGYALIKRVRLLGQDKGGDIPAIALTAYARAEDRVKAVSAGFQMHVAKPVEPVELVTMVAGAAGRTGPGRD